MKIDHFGYAVKNIEKSIEIFQVLGYSPVSSITEDFGRNIKIQFIEKDGITLELIEPIQKDSPVSQLLKKCGSTLYHICYKTTGLEESIQKLLKANFILIEKATPAPAMGG